MVRRAQLPLSILTEPAEVNTAQYFAIWQSVSELIGDVAAGVVKLLRESAPERLHIIEEGEICTIQLKWLYSEQHEPPLLVYITLTTLLDLGRHGTGQPLRARFVELTQPMRDLSLSENL